MAVIALSVSNSAKYSLEKSEVGSSFSKIVSNKFEFKTELNHSRAYQMIMNNADKYVELHSVDDNLVDRSSIIDIFLSLKKHFLNNKSVHDFYQFSFAASCLLWEKDDSATLIVSTIPKIKSECKTLNRNQIKTEQYEAIANINNKLDSAELAKYVALLLGA